MISLISLISCLHSDLVIYLACLVFLRLLRPVVQSYSRHMSNMRPTPTAEYTVPSATLDSSLVLPHVASCRLSPYTVDQQESRRIQPFVSESLQFVIVVGGTTKHTRTTITTPCSHRQEYRTSTLCSLLQSVCRGMLEQVQHKYRPHENGLPRTPYCVSVVRV